MVYLIYMDGNGHKLMRPVNNREEYIALRNGGRQRAYVAAVRNGVERKKSKLVQMCYSCLPNADGRLKGATRVSNTVGMDIDHVAQQDMAPLRDLILSKRQQLGLLMLELSARGRGYHLVFRRRPQLSQVENLEWAARLLGVEFDKGAKDLTRVFFTTTASPDDLLFLDDELFTSPGPSQGGCLADNGGASPSSPCTPASPPSPCTPASPPSPCTPASPPPPGTPAASSPLPSPLPSPLSFKGRPYSDIIDAWWQQNGGVPQEGERNVKLYQLAVALRAICDNNRQLLMQVMPRLGLDEQELQAIVDSACKEPPKGLTRALRDILGTPANNYQPSTLNAQLDDWGAQIEALFADFPILRDICKGLKRNQYPAALIVAGAFEMTLMTRCCNPATGASAHHRVGASFF